MFATLKQIFTPNQKELRHRLYFTLGVLALFVIGTYIRVPGTENLTDDLGFLDLINVMGGGALKNFSIFALGVMPYITASIIMQLLQMDVVPYLSELSKQGQAGRQKLNKITRYVGIGMAFIEGYAFSFAALGTEGSIMQYLFVATILTAGTAFVLWLGDQITKKGIGNGISMIIMAGIVTTLPTMFIEAFNSLIDFGDAQGLVLGILGFALFVIVYLAIIVGVIFVQESERRIPIQYANKSTSSLSKQTFMPIKINSAGVIPVIFASSLVSVPGMIASFIGQESEFAVFVNQYLTLTTPIGFSIYIVLIFLFAYFYTFVQMKPDQLAKNLQNNNGYIPGIRPGNDTEKYVKQVLTRLTVFGSLFLVVLAGLPIIFTILSNMPSTVTIGGTGLLIVVGVALETYKQMESSVMSKSYKKGYSRR